MISNLNRKEPKRLFALVNKYIRNAEVKNILNSRESDETICNMLSELCTTMPDENSGRANYRAAEILRLLERIPVDNIGYLDVGSDDCVITEAIGKSMEIRNICATDIFNAALFNAGSILESNIDFRVNNGSSIPFPDQSFSFITCLQSLHHMRNLDSMLEEIVRVSTPNAVLVIREQNLDNENNQTITDLFNLEHIMYDVVLKKKMSLESFYSEYYAKFHTSTVWIQILRNYGFRHVKSYQKPKYNPTNYYYSVFVRT